MAIQHKGYRYAAKQAQRDKARREAARTIEAAEEAYDAARDAYEADTDEPLSGDDAERPLWAAYRAARDRLYDLDPKNYHFT